MVVSLDDRPRRRKRNTLLGSGEYVLDIDGEIMAMERMEPARLGSSIVTVTHKSRPIGHDQLTARVSVKKRGRPRKHPVVVDTSQPVVKRPRGRPRGSGKRQHAARILLGESTPTSTTDDGMIPGTIPQSGEPAHVMETPATSVVVEQRTPAHTGDMTPVATTYRDAMTPTRASGSHCGVGKKRRKGSLPTKTEL